MYRVTCVPTKYMQFVLSRALRASWADGTAKWWQQKWRNEWAKKRKNFCDGKNKSKFKKKTSLPRPMSRLTAYKPNWVAFCTSMQDKKKKQLTCVEKSRGKKRINRQKNKIKLLSWSTQSVHFIYRILLDTTVFFSLSCTRVQMQTRIHGFALLLLLNTPSKFFK